MTTVWADRPKLTDEQALNLMVRVSGEAICDHCGDPYWKHPMEDSIKDWEGRPFLHRLCDGRLGKL